ncbi:LpqB family beta-propeller domain-containing protein, partial [Streptomyces sp. NPDC029044]|uniref:LpqB family beta-propeller domain-containing protein n=1 Tax=Streptomyces sp. NPDC029044 TaxID=3157198 RepID=UPI00340C7FCC
MSTADATDADAPARGALRALLPALAGHRAMTARTCAAALLEQGSLVALLTLAAHTVGTAVIDGRLTPPSWDADDGLWVADRDPD